MMAELGSSPWWVVAAGALPSLGSGLWVTWRWHCERRDRLRETAASREERLGLELEAQRAALSKEQAELLDRLRTELLRVQTRNHELDHDRDRGWDLARYWHQRAHEVRHAGVNAQTIVESLCARERLPPPDWPDMTLMAFEEPK